MTTMNNTLYTIELPKNFKLTEIKDKNCSVIHGGETDAIVIAKEVFSDVQGEKIKSGRRSAYFKDIKNIGKCVVRQYMRGGMLRFANKNNFTSPDRFIDELKINLHAQTADIPTAEPVALIIQKNELYKGWIVTRQIENATDLLTVCASTENLSDLEELARTTGKVLRKMHDKGIYHGDLNGSNILIEKNNAYIIDFDGSSIIPLMTKELRENNLRRLMRSLIKASLKNNFGAKHIRKFILAGYLKEKHSSEKDFSSLLNENFLTRRIWWRLKGETFRLR